MSAIGGVYHFNRGPISRETLLLLEDGLSRRGPDGAQQACSTPVGMVYRPFHTTRESRPGRSTLVGPGGEMLAWDGRLDNREDLQRALGGQGDGGIADQDIVLAAYRKWGAEFVTHIIGDYALALWDPRQSRLILGRDPFGTRPLFYYRNEEKIIWASEVKALAALSEVPLDVDDDYIASYLTRGARTWQTPYRFIKSIAPASLLIVQGDEVRTERFWKLDPKHEIRYASDWEYEEHFRELFEKAVRSRLRVEGPVCCELSGGLDSSSIVCMADNLIVRGEAEAQKVTTISYVFDESPTSDERDYIRHIEQQRGEVGRHLREEDHPILAPLPENTFLDVPNPQHCFAGRYRHVWQTMQAAGTRVLLSGSGGDHVVLGQCVYPPELADLALRLRPGRLLKGLRDWSRSFRTSYFKVAWEGVVWPLLPRSVQANCGPIMHLPDWYNPGFVSRMNLRERMLGPVDDCGFDLPGGRFQSSLLREAVTLISYDFYLDHGCVEMSYPFLDRPLVEFCVAIPFEQRVRPDETRSLLRRSLRDLLPAPIASRTSKAGPDEAILRAVDREWPRLSKLLSDARVCKRGYAEPKALRNWLFKARHGLTHNTPEILRILSLEFWLRSLEQWSSRRSDVGRGQPRQRTAVE